MSRNDYHFRVVDRKTGNVTLEFTEPVLVMERLINILMGRFIYHYPSITTVRYNNNFDGTITIKAYYTSGYRYEVTIPEH